jgi:hypothetical protein
MTSVNVVAQTNQPWHTHDVYYDYVVRLTYDAIVAAGGITEWMRVRNRFAAIENAMKQYNFILNAGTISKSWNEATTNWVKAVKEAADGNVEKLITLPPIDTATTTTSSNTTTVPTTPLVHVHSADTTDAIIMLVDVASLMRRVRAVEELAQANQKAIGELEDTFANFTKRFNIVLSLIEKNVKSKRTEQPSDEGGGSGSSSCASSTTHHKRSKRA